MLFPLSWLLERRRVWHTDVTIHHELLIYHLLGHHLLECDIKILLIKENRRLLLY